MKLSEIAQRLDLDVKACKEMLSNEVGGGYVSDLLSDVLAHASEGDLWVTLQTHQNTVAVASLKGLAGILLVNDRAPEEETVQKAEQEGVPILVSSERAFELIGRLHGLGISGTGA